MLVAAVRLEDVAYRRADPFLGHADDVAAAARYPSDENVLWSFELGLLVARARVPSRFRVASRPTLFGSLLLEQLVDRVDLRRGLAKFKRIAKKMPRSALETSGVDRLGSPTFSSSLRFSLRFFLRLAISARRMACSSAVSTFFTLVSAGCQQIRFVPGTKPPRWPCSPDGN